MTTNAPETDAQDQPASPAPRRLRVQAVSVQVSLVWDDGEELTAGPQLEPAVLALSAASRFLDRLPTEVAELEGRLAADGDRAE